MKKRRYLRSLVNFFGVLVFRGRYEFFLGYSPWKKVETFFFLFSFFLFLGFSCLVKKAPNSYQWASNFHQQGAPPSNVMPLTLTVFSSCITTCYLLENNTLALVNLITLYYAYIQDVAYHLNICIITGYLRRIVPGAKLNLWLNLSLNLFFYKQLWNLYSQRPLKKWLRLLKTEQIIYINQLKVISYNFISKL